MKSSNNKINSLHRHILQAISALPDTGCVEKPTVKSIQEELKQLQKEEFKQVDFTLDPATVAVTTSPITLEGIYLGPFRIQLNVDSIGPGSPAEYFDVIAMEPHPAATNLAYFHPHVSIEKLCTGDATAPLSAALADGRLSDFFIIIRSVLETYNPDSPYVPLDKWQGRFYECYDCWLEVPENQSYRCPFCHEVFCKDCIIESSGFARIVCLLCLPKLLNQQHNDQRLRKYPGGSTRLPNYAHGRYIERTKPWQARIRYQGKRVSLGVYETKVRADLAYLIALSRIDQGLYPVVR